MSAPDAATVAAVLAAHRRREVWEPPGNMIGWGCLCGWGSEGGHALPSVEAHVAAAILASEPIAQALAAVEAVARVEALAGEWVEDADTKLRGMAARVARDHAAELRALRPEGGNQ